jgi:hypothetical protein
VLGLDVLVELDIAGQVSPHVLCVECEECRRELVVRVEVLDDVMQVVLCLFEVSARY